jgi:hypothetical protein
MSPLGSSPRVDILFLSVFRGLALHPDAIGQPFAKLADVHQMFACVSETVLPEEPEWTFMLFVRR